MTCTDKDQRLVMNMRDVDKYCTTMRKWWCNTLHTFASETKGSEKQGIESEIMSLGRKLYK